MTTATQGRWTPSARPGSRPRARSSSRNPSSRQWTTWSTGRVGAACPPADDDPQRLTRLPESPITIGFHPTVLYTFRHEAPVDRVLFSRDSQYVFSCARDCTVKVGRHVSPAARRCTIPV